MQEIRNSSALAVELCLTCTNPPTCYQGWNDTPFISIYRETIIKICIVIQKNWLRYCFHRIYCVIHWLLSRNLNVFKNNIYNIVSRYKSYCEACITHHIVPIAYRFIPNDNVTSLLANRSAAFIWKLYCHWLKGLWQHSIALVREDPGPLIN